jgi:isoleucyl-tRNA synthetase
MTRFPKGEELATGLTPARVTKWQELLGVREAVLKALEEKRNAKEINASLEARVVLRAGGALGELLREYAPELPALFIVSQVELAAPDAAGGDGGSGLSIVVERARGSKCERCWNYSTRVGESVEHPTVCERCVAALEEIAGTQRR